MSRARRYLRRLVKGLIAIVLVAIVGVALLIAYEPHLIFFPERGHSATPEDFELDAEELTLPSTDSVTVNGYYVRPRDRSEPIAHLLFSHGNGGNLSGRFWLAKQLSSRGLAVLLYDYRGYGHSTDRFPTETGVYADGEAALAVLVDRAGAPERVVLFGRSLGGGVSYELAARHPELAAIITDSTFTSIPDMARRATVFSPLAPLVRTRMDNARRIAEVQMPKLILHGTADQLVPFDMAEELRDLARPPVELISIPGAGHNNTFLVDQERYFGAITSFVERVVH